MDSILETIISFFQTIFQFFIDLVNWAFDSLISLIVDLLIYLISIVPDPCCITESVSTFTWLSNSLHSGGVFSWLAWVYNLVQFEFGLRVVFCAYLARFVLRRIPGIG